MLHWPGSDGDNNYQVETNCDRLGNIARINDAMFPGGGVALIVPLRPALRTSAALATALRLNPFPGPF